MFGGMMKHAVRTAGLYAVGLNLVLALVRAQGADFYVSTSGSDSNPGTSAQPFRTITHAYAYAAPGVTIHVLPGVYYDYTSNWGIHLGASGTASSPIVLISTVVGGAIIDGQNTSDRNEGFYVDGNYNIVDGFEVRNAPLGGFAIYGNGNQIRNNHIHHNGNPASTSTNGRDGIYSDPGTSGNVYAGNTIDHNGRSGSNLDHGLYLCGDNELVLNNVLLANPSCGLQIAGYSTVSNMKVYNNVMAYNGTDGIVLWQALSGIDIKNNIFYQNGHWGVGSSAATGSGVVLNNNLSYGNIYGDFDFAGSGSSYSYSQSGNVLADPRLVNGNAISFDPHLAAGSPAIAAGLNLRSVFTTDMAGAPRPASGPWDLGVYVYGSSSPPADSTPPTVSMSAPANGATVSGSTVTVSASAADNVGVAGVQFQLDGVNLGNRVTATPYRVTWDTTMAVNGLHALTAIASDAAGNQATARISVTVNNSAPASGLTFASTSGAISAPFYVTNGTAIVQPAYTSLTAGGQAIYTFTISAAGNYTVSAAVNAPTEDYNSYFVNIDGQPTDPTMIWDVPVTTGFANRTVSWRGNGTTSSNQFVPKVFSLTVGTHQLIVRGREANTQLGTITIAASGGNTPPTISTVASQTLTAGGTAGPLAFTVSDAQVSAGSLTVTGSSSNPTLVPNANIVLGGSGSSRTVTVTPASGQTGTATITLTVSDGSLTASTSFTVTVNALPAPTVTLTAPVNGASYMAPATINLAASVNANGHTITGVNFYNGTTLIGSAPAAPYTFTWNNVSAANCTVSARAMYDSGSTVASGSVTVSVTNPPPSSSLTFASTSGTITAPFYVTNGTAIVQTAYTSVTAGGQAVYTFTVPAAGNYLVSALVIAPTEDYNSFFVNIDAQPTDPTMIWDVPVTTTFASRTVAWRGAGTTTSDQFSPKVFNLPAGPHQLVVRGREGQVQLGTISIAPTTLPAN